MTDAAEPRLSPEAKRPAALTGPRLDVLLELALHEKRPADVLHWYDRLALADRQTAALYDARVADTVAASHPERAVPLYRSIIESHVRQASSSADEATLLYLRKLRGLLHQCGRAAEWATYLAELREQHSLRPRFLSVLDRVEGRCLAEG